MFVRLVVAVPSMAEVNYQVGIVSGISQYTSPCLRLFSFLSKNKTSPSEAEREKRGKKQRKSDRSICIGDTRLQPSAYPLTSTL
jgi:hypothetical protein